MQGCCYCPDRSRPFFPEVIEIHRCRKTQRIELQLISNSNNDSNMCSTHLPPCDDLGVFEHECDASCSKRLKSSSSIKSRSAICTASILGDSPRSGILRGTNFRFGANGEMEIMPGRLFFGEANSPLRGRDATSEKKKDVCVGVRGVRGIPLGVFKAEPRPPPGENRPLAVGD